MTDDDVLLDSSSFRALQCMDYGYQDVILEEFHCQSHKGLTSSKHTVGQYIILSGHVAVASSIINLEGSITEHATQYP